MFTFFVRFAPLKPLKTTVKEVLEVLLEVLEVALEVLEVALEVPGVLGPKIHVIKRSWYSSSTLLKAPAEKITYGSFYSSTPEGLQTPSLEG